MTRQYHPRPGRATASVAAFACLLGSSIASADDPFEPSWRLAVDFAAIRSDGDVAAVVVDGASTTIDFDNAAGFGLRGEYRFSEMLGLELGMLATASIDITAGIFDDSAGADVGLQSYSPVSLGLNFYPSIDGRVDVYAGAFLANNNYGRVRTGATADFTGVRVSADSDIGWGLVLGMEVPLGKKGWFVHANARYIDASIEGERDALSIDGDFNPTVFALGFGYRF